MASETWAAVDAYLADRLLAPDDALDAALAANAEAGLPPIDVSPLEGRLLYLLARLHGARNVLEVGTLGGVSTIHLARAVGHEGRVTTLEINPKHARVARANLARAAVADRVAVIVGPAAETLPKLTESFDMAFIDADKPSNPIYWREVMRLVRPGGLIVVDNVVRDGMVADDDCDVPAVLGVRAMMDLIAAEPRVEATAVQTVGAKGYDGFLVARVKK